jgi:hypothetical protein
MWSKDDELKDSILTTIIKCTNTEGKVDLSKLIQERHIFRMEKLENG